MGEALLAVKDLKVHFPVFDGNIIKKRTGSIKAVNGVSFQLEKGETLGLVGESGCGKSTTARAILQLVPPTSGEIFFEGIEVHSLKGENLRQIYKRMQIIYQDPYASLDPRMTIGGIIGEPLDCFGVMRGAERDSRIRELLEVVGLDKRFINRYPHEFSGGQRQRIGIARALALNPSLIIADEPVSALDVSIRAQVINLMEDLQKEFGFSYLFIAHDLSVVKHISDRVAVMYLGKIAELSSSDEIYDQPLHPYTKALLSAVPIPDPVVEKQRRRTILVGDVPSPDHEDIGCDFRGRCPIAQPLCAEKIPELREIKTGHFAACHFAE